MKCGLAGVGVVVALVQLWVTGNAFSQGSLGPPGPPAPTMKTLAQVEPRTPITSVPYTISVPGKYFLTGNLNVSSNTSGIIILPDNVTLDLRGFTVTSAGGGFIPGVSSFFNKNITVRNGSLRGWSGYGVDGRGTTNCHFEALYVVGCQFGIAAGPGSTVIGCTAIQNVADGFEVDSNSVVSGCLAWRNGGSGLAVAAGGTVIGCAAGANTTGVSAGNGCTVKDCTANANLSDGIDAASGCTLSGCAVSSNAVNGITTQGGCAISGCTANNNAVTGIGTQGGCAVSGCAANSNGNIGIIMQGAGSIRTCTVQSNSRDGIFVQGNCLVADNTCSANGQLGGYAGIHVVGDANRIEGNNAIYNNNVGIRVDNAGNLILRNSVRGSTGTYSFSAGNSYGQIIDVYNGGTGAIISNSNPWVNWLY